jgi:hypothetical protein
MAKLKFPYSVIFRVNAGNFVALIPDNKVALNLEVFRAKAISG